MGEMALLAGSFFAHDHVSHVSRRIGHSNVMATWRNVVACVHDCEKKQFIDRMDAVFVSIM